jgi:hypothetical protein
MSKNIISYQLQKKSAQWRTFFMVPFKMTLVYETSYQYDSQWSKLHQSVHSKIQLRVCLNKCCSKVRVNIADQADNFREKS